MDEIKTEIQGNEAIHSVNGKIVLRAALRKHNLFCNIYCKCDKCYLNEHHSKKEVESCSKCTKANWIIKSSDFISGFEKTDYELNTEN